MSQNNAKRCKIRVNSKDPSKNGKETKSHNDISEKQFKNGPKWRKIPPKSSETNWTITNETFCSTPTKL